MPIFAVEGIQFIDIQYDSTGESCDVFCKTTGITISHWQDALDNYDETAALISALDLVVSVCTAVVHLGGALGKPVWVLALFSPEWRYMACGEAMPWYPSVRVFRQPCRDEWSLVIAKVAQELLEYRADNSV